MIRPAQITDAPAMLHELRLHHAEHAFAWPFDRVRLSITLANALDRTDRLVLTGEGVLLIASWFDCEFGSGRHAIERILRVPAGQLDTVLAAFEGWARANGCVDVALGCVRRHDVFMRLYRSRGYQRAETTFVKAL